MNVAPLADRYRFLAVNGSHMRPCVAARQIVGAASRRVTAPDVPPLNRDSANRYCRRMHVGLLVVLTLFAAGAAHAKTPPVQCDAGRFTVDGGDLFATTGGGASH